MKTDIAIELPEDVARALQEKWGGINPIPLECDICGKLGFAGSTSYFVSLAARAY